MTTDGVEAVSGKKWASGSLGVPSFLAEPLVGGGNVVERADPVDAALGDLLPAVLGDQPVGPATELGGDEAGGWWRHILERSPEYERYTRAARRTFPIIRLTPAGPAGRAQASEAKDP